MKLKLEIKCVCGAETKLQTDAAMVYDKVKQEWNDIHLSHVEAVGHRIDDMMYEKETVLVDQQALIKSLRDQLDARAGGLIPGERGEGKRQAFQSTRDKRLEQEANLRRDTMAHNAILSLMAVDGIGKQEAMKRLGYLMDGGT